MKIKALFLSLFIAMTCSSVQAQKTAKFGHVNAAELLNLMPERKAAMARMDTVTKEMEKQLQEMAAEFRAKQEKYAADASKLTDLLKADRETELQNLSTRIQNFQQQAEESLQTKQQQLMEPIITKAKKAIEQVAKENGYTYIFDTSTGALLFWEESDNVINLVKKKLNLP
jgi:outer membrane protein